MPNTLKGKRVIVGITGGIAAYKAPLLVRLLTKQGADVVCAATPHALQFVTRLTMETVSNHPLYTDLFERANQHSTEHIALKDWGDAMIVAPATANIMAKMANGIADDALSTLLLSFRKPLFVCPAMNTQMLESPATIRNIRQLHSDGVHIIDSTPGELACGASGNGRMAEPEQIVDIVSAVLASNPAVNTTSSNTPVLGTTNANTTANATASNPAGTPASTTANPSNSATANALTKKKILITAGPTYEKIDSVRFIGNFSTGKMGFAIAEELAERGMEVTLVAGPTHLTVANSGIRRIDVVSAREMFDAATSAFPGCDAAILTAAVADFRPEHEADHKIKKVNDNDGMTITLVQNPDILATLGKMKHPGQKLVGFALETDNEVGNAKNKLARKNLDFIVLNSLRDKGAGFGFDTNKVTIIDSDGNIEYGTLKSKKEVACDIADKLLSLF